MMLSYRGAGRPREQGYRISRTQDITAIPRPLRSDCITRVLPLDPRMQGVEGPSRPRWGRWLLESTAARPELTPAHSLAQTLGKLLRRPVENEHFWEGEKQRQLLGRKTGAWRPPVASGPTRPGSIPDSTGPIGHPGEPGRGVHSTPDFPPQPISPPQGMHVHGHDNRGMFTYTIVCIMCARGPARWCHAVFGLLLALGFKTGHL